MKEVSEILDKFNDWLKLEIENVQPLEGNYLKAFKLLLSTTYDFRELYFNKTSIIVTDIDDYEELKIYCPELKTMYKLESEFNICLYVLSFVDHKKLNTLLGGAA
jgi:hypothetical protein